MRQVKRTLGDWIYSDLDQNKYLQKLYNKLIMEYAKLLQGEYYFLNVNEIRHLLRFSDLLSKSSDKMKEDFHKNIAQNIVCIIEKLYPQDVLNKIYLGSVLNNVNNYVGVEGKCENYKNADIVEGIREAIIKERHRLPDECGTNMYFDAAQGVAFEKLRTNDYYSFSGPTSMGKTFLVKMFIKSLIIKGNRYNYVILVPSKALINEVRTEIINELGNCLAEKNYKVITTPTALKNENTQKYIMIYTQERLSYQIKLHKKMKIDYVFIDEAQKISEVGMRSAYFYKVVNYLIRVNKMTKIYFLCPHILNPQIYLKLIPNSKEKFYDIFEFSPVNQHKSIVDLRNKEIDVYSDLSKEFISLSFEEQNTTVMDFVYHMGKNSSNIVFCDSKKLVESNAIEYWKKCKKDDAPELKSLIEDIKRDIHPKSFLVYFLERGICCHVGYLPSAIKAKIEKLFRDKVIKTIFCTSTLLEGVNLPADNLFIVIKNKSYILKNSADFRNLMGRVGRKTYNLIGNVYVVPQTGNSETFERCKELINSPVENQTLSIDKILNNKLKNTIIESLVNGSGTIEKRELTYEVFGMARFIINILIKCIIEKDQNNYIYKLFERQLDDSTIQTIYDNFKDQVIDDDSNVTLDQIQKLDKEIAENRITYPETIDFESVKSFLEQLYILFQWEKYESKMEIGKKERLAYYAVLLSQWMMGHSVRRIIDKSIEYHRNTGKIYDDNKKGIVSYEGKNSQDNSIVIECLTAVEDVLLFSISNYFTKFSERYKIIKKVEALDNDWSEYLDFGTNDRLIIELQKIGFSREIAKELKKEGIAQFTTKNTLIFRKDIQEADNEELLRELNEVKLNYAELFRVFF